MAATGARGDMTLWAAPRHTKGIAYQGLWGRVHFASYVKQDALFEQGGTHPVYGKFERGYAQVAYKKKGVQKGELPPPPDPQKIPR